MNDDASQSEIKELLQFMVYSSFNKVRQSRKEMKAHPTPFYYSRTENGYKALNNPDGIGENDDSDCENEVALARISHTGQRKGGRDVMSDFKNREEVNILRILTTSEL